MTQDRPNRTPDSPQEAYDLRLLFICHAETMHTRYADLANQDSGLTAQGWQQTNALANWLKSHYRIDMLISAPQLRNRLTAQRIGQAISLPVTVHQGWSHQFQPTGSLVGELAVAVPLLIAHIPDEASAEPDAADQEARRADFCRDLLAVIDQLRSQCKGQTVAMVMGPAAVSAALGCIFATRHLSAIVDHASITEVQIQHGRWSLLCANRREHAPMPALVAVESRPAQAPDDTLEDLSPVVQLYNKVAAAKGAKSDDAARAREEDLLAFAALPAGLSVLDVGTGSGALALALAEYGAAEVVGIDISPVMLETAEYLRLHSEPEVARRVDFRLAAAQALPFRNERFDVAVCRLLLHHSRKPEQILRELVRVLCPGGLLILADLLSADDPVKRATQNAIEERRNPTHVAARSVQQYRDLITGAGLAVVAEKVVVFERELEEWLAELSTSPTNGAIVREMIEAGLETDAAGIHARRLGEKLLFDQRIFYLKARKG